MPSLTPDGDSKAAKVTQESPGRISRQVIGVGNALSEDVSKALNELRRTYHDISSDIKTKPKLAVASSQMRL